MSNNHKADEKRTANPKRSRSWGRILTRIIPTRLSLAIADPIRRRLDPPRRLVAPYVKEGFVVADLGCGVGFYTFALAELVGPQGKVYAIDMDRRSIEGVKKKAAEGGYLNIDARTSSAEDLSFIPDRSVDFILADGLL